MPSPNFSSDVLNAERRAWNYWFVDGLPNLLAGILCILLAIVFLLLSGPPHNRSPLVIVFVFVAFGIYFIVFFRFRQTLEWLKKRITYPRTGYIAAPYFANTSAPSADLVMLNLSGVGEKETNVSLLVSEDLRWRLWIMLATVIAEPLAGKFIASHILCVVAGCAGGLLVWLASRKDPRKSWAVVFGLLFPQYYIGYVSDHLHALEGAAFFQAGVGFVLALMGAIMFIRYLHRNPVAGA